MFELIAKVFNPAAFFIAFGVGILAVQVMANKPRVVIRHPSLENAGRVKQEDDNGNCQRFEARRENCPVQDRETSQVPLKMTERDDAGAIRAH